MENSARVIIGSVSDIVLAREHVRRIGRAIGFHPLELTRMATGISEIARNMVTYAETGEISIQVIEKGGKQGIEIKAQDKGPGIRDITLAMSDGYSTGKGRGLGLPGVRRLMDEFDVESRTGTGTTVTMRKWITKAE